MLPRGSPGGFSEDPSSPALHRECSLRLHWEPLTLHSGQGVGVGATSEKPLGCFCLSLPSAVTTRCLWVLFS